MLLIRRKLDERLKIGNNIEIVVVSIKVNEHVACPNCNVTNHVDKFVDAQVELGIQAPREIKIIRGELKPHGSKNRNFTR